MRNQTQDPAVTELRVAALFNILQVRADLTAGGTDLIGRCLTRPLMPLRIKTLTHKPKSLPTHNLMLSHRSTDVSRTVSFFFVFVFSEEETRGGETQHGDYSPKCFSIQSKRTEQTAAVLSFPIWPCSLIAVDFLWFVIAPARCWGRELTLDSTFTVHVTAQHPRRGAGVGT